MEFFVCNAFASRPFAGNPAGVVLDDACALPAARMQQIAAQLALVETVFVTPAPGPGHACAMRYFTPREELPIAGHPTLAAWHVMREFGRAGIGPARITTPGGDIAVRTDGPAIFLTQGRARPRALGPESRAQICRAFGLAPGDLCDAPPMAVDAGLGHLIFGLRSRAALEALAHPGVGALAVLCRDCGMREVQAFALEDGALHTRNFAPRTGAEDPACGNGNAALGAYLLDQLHPGRGALAATATQGSGAQVEIRAERGPDGAIGTEIGGRAVTMIRGEVLK